MKQEMNREACDRIREVLRVPNSQTLALRVIRKLTGCGLATAQTVLGDIEAGKRWTYPQK